MSKVVNRLTTPIIKSGEPILRCFDGILSFGCDIKQSFYGAYRAKTGFVKIPIISTSINFHLVTPFFQKAKTKKLSCLLRAAQLFIASPGNPAIPLRILWDPWLSVTRLLGFWRSHESILIDSFYYI
jgi:hypothetical protein